MIKTSQPMIPVIHVIGGGTVSQVRPHLSIAAEAYGNTARSIADLAVSAWGPDHEVRLHLTKMATSGRNSELNTVQDMERLMRSIVEDPATKVVFMSAAMADFNGHILEGSVPTESGLTAPRLRTRVQVRGSWSSALPRRSFGRFAGTGRTSSSSGLKRPPTRRKMNSFVRV